MDDRELAELFYARSDGALTAFTEKYGRLCRQIASGILADPRDVEECLNDSLLALWERVPKERPNQLAAYACRIVRNISMDRLDYNRAKKRDAGNVLPVDELVEAIPDENLRADGSDRELGQAIDRFLRSQKPQRADIFVRRYFCGSSVREIAAHYRYTESRVRSLLSRMRGQLKEYLKKEGYYFEE